MWPSHAVMNPDIQSERRLLSQLAPELDEDMMLALVGAFHDLREEFDAGTLTYPFSLRGMCMPSIFVLITHGEFHLRRTH